MGRRSAPVRTLLLLAALALALAASACSARQAATPAAPAATVVLLDVSGSTDAVRESYLAQVEQVVASAAGAGTGQRVVVLPVSSASLTSPPLLDVTFPKRNAWQTTAFTFGRSVRKQQQEAMSSLRAALEAPRPDARGSHILDGLLRAADILKSYPEGAGAVVVVSDMIEQSDAVDLESLTEAGIPAALAAAEKAGRLAQLHGARVTVTGLAAAATLPPARVLAIRAFWTALLERAGAGGLDGYAPTLAPAPAP